MREMFDDDETSPGVLAERIGMTRGRVSRLVGRLVNKELITRGNRSDDRRNREQASMAHSWVICEGTSPASSWCFLL